MDRPFFDQVLEALGPRYRAGASSGSGVELLYRAGRAEFRPSRAILGGGESGRELELMVDVRIPKGCSAEDADRLVEAFEASSAQPRGFARTADAIAPMRTESGQDSGSVRNLRYLRPAADVADTAKQVRAMVETVDIPIVVGIHEPEHLRAQDPPPPRERVKRPLEPLELWEYQLDGGLLRSLLVIIDPNDRTLSVVERRLLSRQTKVDKLKLAHVARLKLRREARGAALSAVARDGTETLLATGSGSDSFLATVGRMAKKIMVPLE